MRATAKTPKTWASTHSAAKGAYPGTRKSRPNRGYKASAREAEKELEERKLEKGLTTYSYRMPVGPQVAPGSRFIEPRHADTPDSQDGQTRTALSKPGARLAAPWVAYSDNAVEADDLVECLGPGPLGLDLEWNFSYESRKTHRTALLQICSSSLVLILHISAMEKLPPALLRVLQDPNVVKTGVSIRNDALKLQTDFGIRTRSIVELSRMAKLAHPDKWAGTNHLISLRKLSRIYLGRRLDKGPVRVSNWETLPLSLEQQEYAANDTFAGLEILRELCSYFPPADAELSLLKQLDGLDNRTPKRVDIETALRLSSYDLHQEHLDSQRVEAKKQDRAALRSIQLNAQSIARPAFIPAALKSRSRGRSADDDEDSDSITVTSVILAHNRAMNKWLYGNQTIDQIALSSQIKPNTTANYLIKALTEARNASRNAGTSGIIKDFSTKDKLRLDQELQDGGQSLALSRKAYRDVAGSLGWTSVLPALRKRANSKSSDDTVASFSIDIPEYDVESTTAPLASHLDQHFAAALAEIESTKDEEPT